ncbi:MAG TPA: PASTA domain-containing protein [Pyrinomonadaceae bacterium]|nr:PASTA domain-containing protein [Pyrinomonadaceae bacterium]
MSILSTGFSAIGKLVMVVVLLVAFLSGMAGVVYMSLSGSELKVPEIVGKDFVQSEKELASLGLKIKKRADRVSEDPMNTVLEQLPKAGETVKTGQMILVVVSKAGAVGEETPSSLKKDIEEDDTEKIEEMISDKPKKAKANSNTNKKKADTTRDVIANESSTNTSTETKETAPKETDAEKKETPDKPKETTPTKPQGSPAGKAPGETKPKQ